MDAVSIHHTLLSITVSQVSQSFVKGISFQLYNRFNWQLGLQFDVSKVCLLPWNTAGNAGHRLGGAPAFERTQKDAAAYSARCVAHLGSAPAPASRRMLSA